MIRPEIRFPPGGWPYFEPSTNWHAPLPLVHDRFQTAQDISKHRKANPHKFTRTGEAECLADLLTYTYHRLKADPNYVLDDPLKKNIPNRNEAATTERRGLMSRVAQLAVAGPDTLLDWFGDGLKPVPFPIAQARANVCEVCPKNVKGDWLNRLTAPIANAVLKHVKLKTMLNLEVSNEKELGTCEACECQLPLKVWVPLENIQMSADTMARLHHACWILSEKSAVGGSALP